MATTKDAKLLRQTKFPIEFNQKVDMKKVNVEVMKKWIAGRISEILGNEDDVVIELCFNLLEESRFPDIKDLQIKLTGFLDKDTPKFCKELWNLCLSAQSNAQGVPKELLEAKKMELKQEKIESEKAAQVARQRKETDQARERNIDTIRQRERSERGRGGGRPQGRGGFDRRPPPRNNSRSPPPYRGHRRDSRSPPRRRGSPPFRDNYREAPRRDRDIYVPRGRSDRYEDRRRRRSRSIDREPAAKRRRSSSSLSPPRRRPAAASNDQSRKESITHSHSSSRSYSRSRSPPPARSAHRRTSPSRSRSRSPAPRHNKRRKRTPSNISDTRSGSGSGSRSRDPTPKPSFREPRAHDRAKRSPSHSRSRSRTPAREEKKKRQRSMERYQPAGHRKRRNSSSSVSSRDDGRNGDKKTTLASDKMDIDGGKNG